MIAKSHGFSLVEILVAIAALSTLVGIGLVAITRVPDDARKKKLDQDVAIVNNAIDAFLMAGGSAGQLSEANVISALKQRIGPSSGPADIIGPQGPFLDPSVFTAPTDFEWSAQFATSPSPHFYVEKSGNGIVFTRGPASAVGGVAERDDAARSEWVWAYASATPPSLPDAFVPVAVDGATGWTNVAVVAVALDPPVITPGSLSTNLWGFPLAVTIANPNPQGSSRIYYKANNGNYTLYDNTPFQIEPETVLTAVAVSLDPSRYYNSGAATEAYQVIPFNLEVNISAPASINYAQAGGLMVGQAQQSPATATINLENIQQIPPPYLNSGNFNIRYTMDGSDPVSSGTAVTGSVFQGYYPPIAIPLGLATWGTNASLQIRAVAVASNTAWFVSSGVTDATVTALQQTLDAPTITPPAQVVSGIVGITMAKPAEGPVGMEIRYTTDNTVPTWGNGILYTTNFILQALGANEERFVQATTFPGSTANFMTNWFLPSMPLTHTYIGAAGFGTSLPSGILVGSAALGNSGVLRGSVVIAKEGAQSNLPITGAARVEGNLYLPGTPAIYVGNTSANNSWTPARDGRTSWPAFSEFILGKEYGSDGKVVSPNSPGWSPAPRVVDLDGDASPTNYHVLISGSSRVEGKVFRRASSPSLPTVPAPPAKANSGTINYGWGTVVTVNPAPPTSSPASFNAQSNSRITAKAGNYGKVTVSNEARLVLGDASNPEDVQYYTFESLEAIGSSAIEIVGKVVITINYSAGNKAFATSNSATVGNSAHPDWLQVNVYSSAAPNAATTHVNIGGSGSFYGRLNAPKGLVKVGNSGSFRGAVTALKMDMSGAGGADIEFNLSPVMD